MLLLQILIEYQICSALPMDGHEAVRLTMELAGILSK